MTRTLSPPFRVLFLCTHNSARSQIAEALLGARGGGRFVAASAGSDRAPTVHPMVVELLASLGIDRRGRRPRGLEAVAEERWDLVITVCDRARESCARLPGRPLAAHWGMRDPVAVEGDEAARRAAFRDTVQILSRRIDLLLALPLEKQRRLAMGARLRAIAEEEA
ncbi:MAG: arsenate reductase ArsC [Gemmatimonadota bacterium]